MRAVARRIAPGPRISLSTRPIHLRMNTDTLTLLKLLFCLSEHSGPFKLDMAPRDMYCNEQIHLMPIPLFAILKVVVKQFHMWGLQSFYVSYHQLGRNTFLLSSIFVLLMLQAMMNFARNQSRVESKFRHAIKKAFMGQLVCACATPGSYVCAPSVSLCILRS